jgi:branched-chain amino acid transport system substrate-binding protein
MLQRTWYSRVTAVAVALAVLVGGLLAPVAAQQPIKIGIVGPMAFVQGEHHWNGALLARDAINAAGGIQVGNAKRPVELVRVDSNEIMSVPDAASAVERALTRDRVDFLIGGFRSEAVLAMQEVAMDYKKIFLGVGAAHDELGLRVQKDPARYKYWFRVSPVKSSDLGRLLFAVLGSVAEEIRTALGVPAPRVAILAEKAIWVEPLVKVAQANLPKMKMEVVGLWQPSPVATDVTAELSAIQRAGAQLVLTIISGPMGIVMARQMGELQVPAIPFGINVEAQKDGFWAATAQKANYVSTLNTYADVEITPRTRPFVEAYRKRFGGNPTYTAGTHDAVLLLKDAIEKVGTLDADKLVEVLQKIEFVGTAGKLVFDKHHDPTFGPGFTTGLGVQWQDGQLVAFWPKDWHGITYPGVQAFRIPPYMKK